MTFQLTRKRAILAGFGFLVTCLIAVSVVSYFSLTRLLAYQDLQETSFQVRHALGQVASLLADAETAQRGFVITGVEDYLTPFSQAMKQLPAQLETLRNLAEPAAPAEQDDLAALERLVARKLNVIQFNIAARREHGMKYAEEQVASGRGKEIMEAVRAQVTRMEAAEAARLKGLSANLDAAGNRARHVVLAGTCLAVLCAGFSLDQVRRAFEEKSRARMAVQKANTLLEQRVEERTQMLRETLRRLELENEERRQLEVELLRTSEREQRRIAEDLHDGLGQLLAGALHLITALEHSLATQAVADASEAGNLKDLMKEALEQARSTARGLYPVRDTPKGLAFALADLARRIQNLFAITCEFHHSGHVLLQDNAVATHLYRIAQEAANNAVKHGRASRVDLGLSSDEAGLRLEVQDDGTGFAPGAESPDGMGIRIMRRRATISGGTIQFESRPEGGVRVICRIPFKP